jgi:nitrogen fixation protein FixH
MTTAHNYWPLGILLAFVLFILGTAGLIVLAASQRSDLVSDNYYEQEMKYQTRIDSLDRARKLGSSASVSYDANGRRIMISLPAEHAGRRVTGQVQLYRPSAAGCDRQFRLEPDDNGAQSLDAAALATGLWKVCVAWRMEGQDYFLEQKIVVGESPN